MKITVVGTGYVGLVTGVMLALIGHNVICVGRNKVKIDGINSGTPPFFEPGLTESLKEAIDKHKIIATNDLRGSLSSSDITIIAVGTPTVEGRIDLSEIKNVSQEIGKTLSHHGRYHVVVVKSTVVPGTTEKIVKPIIERYAKKKVGEFGLCMNPEFLREGSAVNDATRPDRIIIGQYDEKSGLAYGKVYADVNCPVVYTNLPTAEMIKYVSNSLLSTLISYSNEIARICEKVSGVDAVDVWRGLHLDGRLSPLVDGKRIEPGILKYILSGCGYGGSCFPKDSRALQHFARTLHIATPILDSAIDINRTQPLRIITLLKKALGSLNKKHIAVLGLSFKANTDDVRESPSIIVIKELVKEGANVFCHDPQVYRKNVPEILKKIPVVLTKTVKDTLYHADAALILTAWEEYVKLTPQFFKKYLAQPVIIDGRRIYDRRTFQKVGILYKGIGYNRDT